MAENVDPDRVDFQPSKKLLKTSCGNQFSSSATDEKISVLLNGCVPKNTLKNNEWAQGVWCDWVAERNGRTIDGPPRCSKVGVASN